jgi:uncharacterized membrane protein YbhN (UPF0104 family)
MQPSEPRTPRRRFPGWLKNLLGVVVVVLTLYFLVGRLVRDWHQIPWSTLRVNYALLAGAFGIFFFAYIPLYGLMWKVLLAGLGERISLFNATSVLGVSQIGKYIPGKLWFALGRIYLAKKHGISEAKTAVSVLMETGFALLTAVLLFGLAAAFLPRYGFPRQVYLSLLLIPLCLVVIYPPVLNRVISYLLRRLNQPVFNITLSWGHIAAVAGLYVLMWLVQGIGCFALIGSFFPLTMAKLPMLVGGYAISWILGFVVLISPAGLGIREGVFSFALKLIVPEPVAIISALMSRVWLTVAEGLTALFFTLLLRLRRQEAK